MTSILRPSDGAVRQGAHIDLNIHGLRGGDRILFEPEYGRPCIDTIDLVEGNAMAIDGTRYCVTTCKARFRPARGEEWERALLAALEAAYASDPIGYQQERARLVRKAKRG